MSLGFEGENSAKNRLKVVLCEALIAINEDDEHPIIPPTAIDWIGNALVGAVIETLERQTRYVWIPRESPPEGFLRLAQWLNDDGTEMRQLWAAPGEGSPYHRDHTFVVSDGHIKEQYVTPWSRLT